MTETAKNTTKKATTKKVTPVKVDRLANNKTFTYTDKNGAEHKYVLQFPGVVKTWEMIDNATMQNGQIAKSILADEYIRNVVVEPQGLTLDSFDYLPGLDELYNAIDLFLGEKMSD
ncbi:hypothetical protein [Ligilactobacillus saerimneri]|uniref:hypothetical protein n=1 Tax=Ligilactobacillus saerimneri TaxID=228229 RepID=UPI0024B8DE01|nr:hypothetical protein [Ligilactobacillus saerimneri]